MIKLWWFPTITLQIWFPFWSLLLSSLEMQWQFLGLWLALPAFTFNAIDLPLHETLSTWLLGLHSDFLATSLRAFSCSSSRYPYPLNRRVFWGLSSGFISWFFLGNLSFTHDFSHPSIDTQTFVLDVSFVYQVLFLEALHNLHTEDLKGNVSLSSLDFVLSCLGGGYHQLHIIQRRHLGNLKAYFCSLHSHWLTNSVDSTT
jgi:hypothetical protein